MDGYNQLQQHFHQQNSEMGSAYAHACHDLGNLFHLGASPFSMAIDQTPLPAFATLLQHNSGFNRTLQPPVDLMGCTAALPADGDIPERFAPARRPPLSAFSTQRQTKSATRISSSSGTDVGPADGMTAHATAAFSGEDIMLNAALALMGARQDSSGGGGAGFVATPAGEDEATGSGAASQRFSDMDLGPGNASGFVTASIRLKVVNPLKRASLGSPEPSPCRRIEEPEQASGGLPVAVPLKRPRHDLGESDDLARTEKVKGDCRREAAKLSDMLRRNVASYSERQATELLSSLLSLTRCGPSALLAAMAAGGRRASEQKPPKPSSVARPTTTLSGRVTVPPAVLREDADLAPSSRRGNFDHPTSRQSSAFEDGGTAIRSDEEQAGDNERPESPSDKDDADLQPLSLARANSASGGLPLHGANGSMARASSAPLPGSTPGKLVGAAKRKGGIKNRNAAAEAAASAGSPFASASADEGPANATTSSGRVSKKNAVAGGVFGEDSSAKKRTPRPLNKISNVHVACNQILRLIDGRTVYEREIREILGNNPDTSKALRLLTSENKAIRGGAGGRSDPFRYVLTSVGAAALQELASNTSLSVPSDGMDTTGGEDTYESGMGGALQTQATPSPGGMLGSEGSGPPPTRQLPAPRALLSCVDGAAAPAVPRSLPRAPCSQRTSSLPLPMSALARVPLPLGGSSGNGTGGLSPVQRHPLLLQHLGPSASRGREAQVLAEPEADTAQPSASRFGLRQAPPHDYASGGYSGSTLPQSSNLPDWERLRLQQQQQQQAAYASSLLSSFAGQHLVEQLRAAPPLLVSLPAQHALQESTTQAAPQATSALQPRPMEIPPTFEDDYKENRVNGSVSGSL